MGSAREATARRLRAAAAVLMGTAALASLFYVLNPYWYLDGVIYARDIQEGRLWIEPGHLAWRPLGALLHAILSSVMPDLDPLSTLRILSAIGAGILCILSYRLALRLALSRRAALAATAVLAISNAVLTLGGSGSSYVPAAMFIVAALLCFVRPSREWTMREGLLGTLAIVGAVSFWGTAAFVMPGFLAAAFLYSSGDWRRRAVRAIAVGALATIVVLALMLAAYARSSQAEGFVAYLGSSGHGIPARLSALGFARAGYGLLLTFAHLGSAGREVKSLLLGSGEPVALERLAILAIVTTLIVAVSVLAVAGVWRAIRHDPTRRWAAVVAASCVPLVVFASLWQGSDLERYTPIIAPLVITLVMGIEAARARFERTAAAAPILLFAGLLVLNSVTLIVPRRFGDEAMTWQLGRAASEHIERGSLLVVTGQDLWGAVTAATRYLWDIEAFNVHYVAGFYGADAARARLCEKIDESLAAGASVAVLSDLRGVSTPGGVGLVEAEHSDPSMEELQAFFEPWEVRDTWRAHRFEFFALAPPVDEAICDAVRSSSTSLSSNQES